MRVSKSYFSLLELVLALLILSGTITVLLKDRATSVRRTTETAEDRRAMQLLQSKMSEIILNTEEETDGEFEGFTGFHWSAQWEEQDVEGLETLGSIMQIKLSVFTPSDNEHQLVRLIP